MIIFILLASAISFLISFISTYIVSYLAPIFGLVDDKSHRKHPAQIHQGTIPRSGGIAILLGITIPAIFLLPINQPLIGILSGALFAVIVGVIDDKYDLNPYVRFGCNIISALLVVGSGIGIPYINNPFDGVIRLDLWRITVDLFGSHTILILADIVAVLFIIWIMNIVGWSSGVDGQLPGFIVISSFVLGILSLRFTAHDISQWVVTTLAFITLGSYLGFLPWNFYPQKIMPGYGGKSLAGFMLAVLSILSGAKIGTMVLVLSLPIADGLYTMLRRIISGKSPVWADNKHLHHRLLYKGWGKRRVAVFYWVISAVMGTVALTVSSEQKLFALLTMIALVGGIILWTSRATSEFDV